MRKKNNVETISKYLEKYMDKKFTMATENFIYYGDDFTVKQVMDDVQTTKSELSIFERIEICGIEKEEIQKRARFRIYTYL
jgi:hypothetical protein